MRLNQRAVTLVELLAAMAILGIIMLPMYNILQVALKSWKFEDTRSEVVQNARIAMERMTHEIREARQINDPASDNWTETKLKFWWKDDDGDGVADADEWITYELSGTDLNRTEVELSPPTVTTEPVANYVQNFEIEYRNEDGESPGVAADIHLITVTLTIAHEGHSTTVRASIQPRNI